ncbi:MAG: hypothetical protein HYV77_02620 [Candidatus Wildermuthbacteria bacterium]|nr:hypothetical protein [Candidatus Wildermuthbacteria bacterium]
MSEDPHDLETVEKKGAFKIYMSWRRIMLNNFLGGIAWGFGTVMGATVVIALLAVFFNWLGGVPFIGGSIQEIMDSIRNNSGK